MTTTFEVTGQVAPDHPALAGHFPGYPITPGVVLMNLIANACEGLPGPRRITGWPHVKFVSPLLPRETYVIGLTLTATDAARFVVHVDSRLVASGQVTFALDP